MTPWTNSMLIFCRKAFIGQRRCQMVFMVGDRVCAHFSRDVDPLLSSKCLAPSKDCVPSPWLKSTPKVQPWLTVGMVFFGLYSVFLALRTRPVELSSSDHITFFQASSESSRWSVTNFMRACTCCEQRDLVCAAGFQSMTA